VTGFFAAFYERLFEVMIGLAPSTLAMAAICTALYFVSGQACNPGKAWWRNRGLITDAWYWLIIPFLSPYIRTMLLLGIAAFSLPFVTQDQIGEYVSNGFGPVSTLGFWGQVAFYLLVSDFLLYWIHRKFHGVQLWRFHAIHHSVKRLWVVNTGRFHFVDSVKSIVLAMAIMVALGAPMEVVTWFSAITAYVGILTHCNVEMRFGWLSVVFNTPELHRWHHSRDLREGDKNFGENIMLWDWVFGTWFNEARRPPVDIGIKDDMPPRFRDQLVWPFRRRTPP